MRSICFFGKYDSKYHLFKVLIYGVRKNNVSVVECKIDPNHLKKKKPLGIFQEWYVLTKQFLKQQKKFNHIVVLGSLHPILLAWILSLVYKKKISYRIVVSQYVTEVEEKRIISPKSIRAKCRFIGEKLIYNVLDLILVETEEFGKYYSELFKISPKKITVLPIGSVKEDLQKYYWKPKDNVFKVVYWGNFLPQHGVEYILEAAHILRNQQNIQFILIGKGFLYNDMRKISGKMNLRNLKFKGWISSSDDLKKGIAKADVVLGFFGTTGRALRSVGNKPFEGLAMKKPVITGSYPPVEREFNHRKEMYLVEPGKPHEIARAILELHNDVGLRKKIAENGHALFLKKFSEDKIGLMLINYLKKN